MLKEVEDIYIQMIFALLTGEKVNLLIDDLASQAQLLAALKKKKSNTNNLRFYNVPTVDTWIRDYGPIFLKRSVIARRPEGPTKQSKLSAKIASGTLCPRNDGGITFTKWIFNAWGGKYKDLARDNDVVDRVSYLKNFKRLDPGVILEGGSIDVNGRGTLLTSEQCLLNKNRNRKLSKRDIEGYLKKYLSVQKIIWLKEGIEGDDTDGHIDDITRFVNPGTVLTAVEPNKLDKNHRILKTNLEILRNETDQNGRKLKIIELPMPGKVGPARPDTRHSRLPASYVNFYIANKVVLLPIYSHRNDAQAIRIVRKAFPSRKIVPIECTSLVYGLGSIHCVTQQQPK